MLLSDPSIEALLRDELVPCWESVHDTAKVTIEFGNGKKLNRTIGGNTVIYLCRPDGGVVDAFPGVYTPTDFHLEAKLALQVLKGNEAGMSDLAIAALHRTHLPVRKPLNKSKIGATTISKRSVESPLRFGLRIPASPIKTTPPGSEGTDLDAPLRDTSKYAANATHIRKQFLASKDRERLSPEAFGRRMVELDSQNNRLVVRPRVHELLAASAQALTAADWQRAMFVGLLDTDLSDPYFGLLDVLLPGTPGISP